MGNSPSKNDPLPNSLASLSGHGVCDQSDLDNEDAVPPLSRPTGNGSEQYVQSLKNNHFDASKSPHVDHKTSSSLSQSTPISTPSLKVTPSVGPQAIPARSSDGSSKTGSRLRRTVASSSPSNPDVELDVDMALLLNGNMSSPHSPKDWLGGSSLPSLSNSSSADSQNGLSVFTSSGENKDESSVSSVSSNSSDIGKPAPPLQAQLESLDPILELSSESSFEPREARRSSKSSVQAVPKFSELGKKLVSKTNGVTSTPSSPPLLPSTKKVGFDLDGVIERLLAIGSKRSNSGLLKSRTSRDKLPVTPQEIKQITAKARSVFLDQPTMLKLSPPVKIVGDIHGQYHDLIRIFNSCGYPPFTNYLFLGDYVDRGYKSLETILLLLCYKIKYPENFFMLRGNHESANITKIYGFYDECKRRLPLISGSQKLWKNFVDVFNCLPIAATINDKIFCIHGGLSPELQSMKQIEHIQRPTDIPDKGLLADLLWSDPDASVKGYLNTAWPKNDRGVSYCFGKKHVDNFLSRFNMDLIVRGHMVVEDGYEFFNKRKLVTVFSAPNYCGDFNNYGAIMSVDKTLCCSFELLKPQ